LKHPLSDRLTLGNIEEEIVPFRVVIPNFVEEIGTSQIQYSDHVSIISYSL